MLIKVIFLFSMTDNKAKDLVQMDAFIAASTYDKVSNDITHCGSLQNVVVVAYPVSVLVLPNFKKVFEIDYDGSQTEISTPLPKKENLW